MTRQARSPARRRARSVDCLRLGQAAGGGPATQPVAQVSDDHPGRQYPGRRNLPFQEGRHGNLVGRVEPAGALLAGRAQRFARPDSPPDNARARLLVKVEAANGDEVDRPEGVGGPLGIRERVQDREAHVRSSRAWRFDPSTNSTIEWTSADCWVNGRRSSFLGRQTPNRKCASMISNPLFIKVAESIVIFGPIFQVGWARADPRR